MWDTRIITIMLIAWDLYKHKVDCFTSKSVTCYKYSEHLLCVVMILQILMDQNASLIQLLRIAMLQG